MPGTRKLLQNEHKAVSYGRVRADSSSVPRQLPAAPMMIFARRIKHPLNVAVQGSHDADARRASRPGLGWGAVFGSSRQFPNDPFNLPHVVM
jgi:hypothetical protein